MNTKDDLNTIFEGINSLFDSKKVVGDIIEIDKTTIIPLIEITCGMAVGEFKDKSSSGGMGTKVSPVACIIIKDGMTKVVNIKNKDPLNKLVEILPDLINKLTNSDQISSDAKESIKNMKPHYDESV